MNTGEKIRMAFRWLLAATMVGAGAMHFRATDTYMSVMPRGFPAPRLLVLISGFFEIAGGLGLLAPKTRRLASWGLIALFLAVLPANINMAVNDVPVSGHHFPAWALWLRLPFQFVFMAWAWWVGKEKASPRDATHEPGERS